MSAQAGEIVHTFRTIGDSVDARNYSSLAALIFLLLDFSCTLRNEVKYMWRLPPYRLPEALYAITRYFPIFVQTTSYIFVHVYLLKYPVSTQHCKIWFTLLGATMDVLAGVMDLILLLRVYALYRKNTSILLVGALPLLIGKHVLAHVLLGTTTYGEPSFSDYCDLQTSIVAAPLGGYTLLTHFVLWYAIFRKRNVSDAELLRTVVQESHWILAVSVLPTLVMIPLSFHTVTNPFIIFVWPMTLSSITLSRILIKVNHYKAKAARTTRNLSTYAYTTDMFSTILDGAMFHMEGRDIVESHVMEIHSSQVAPDHISITEIPPDKNQDKV